MLSSSRISSYSVHAEEYVITGAPHQWVMNARVHRSINQSINKTHVYLLPCFSHCGMKLFSHRAALLMGSCSPQTWHIGLDSVSFPTLARMWTTAVAFSWCIIRDSLKQTPYWQTFSRWAYTGLSWWSLSFLTSSGQGLYQGHRCLFSWYFLKTHFQKNAVRVCWTSPTCWTRGLKPGSYTQAFGLW